MLETLLFWIATFTLLNLFKSALNRNKKLTLSSSEVKRIKSRNYPKNYSFYRLILGILYIGLMLVGGLGFSLYFSAHSLGITDLSAAITIFEATYLLVNFILGIIITVILFDRLTSIFVPSKFVDFIQLQNIKMGWFINERKAGKQLINIALFLLITSFVLFVYNKFISGSR